MHPVITKTLALIWAGLLAFVIALAAQAVWAGVITANLASTPAIPWSVPVMAAVLWGLWRYLDGWGRPHSKSETRHRYLRASWPSRAVLAWALLAGGLSVAALAGLWIVMAKIVRLPGNGSANVSGIPLWTAVLFIGMGALVSPVLEQAGFFGYAQTFLERRFPKLGAAVIIAVIYAFGPHPPAGNVIWPRLIFYFLAGLTFALMASMSQSILPGLIVHILGILAFFTLVWPNDPVRSLISQGGLNAGFWMAISGAVVFTGLAIWAFRELWKVTHMAQAGSLGEAVTPARSS